MLAVNFNPFPELKTQRLLLRKLETSDAGQMLLLRSNKEVLRYLGKEPMKSVTEAEEFIGKINKSLMDNESILWGITLSEDRSTIIGTICLWNIVRENYRAEIGYLLHPDQWGRGFMKESIIAVLDYGFDKLKLHSIEAQLSSGNTASVAVLESTGFIKEGHLKENFCFRGEFSDTLIYSRLA